MANYGLVLSGGAARGIAHIGVLKALEELNLKPSAISGVSAGALVGAFYAAGYNPDQIFSTLMKTNVLRMLRPAMNRMAILKLDRTASLINRYLPKKIEDLKIPFTVNTTDLNTGFSEYFSEGEILKPLQASCAIPIIFDPIIIHHHHHIDGGLLNNLPVEPFLGLKKILGVHVNPKNTQYENISMKKIAERSFSLALSHNVQARKLQCDFLIEPNELAKYSLFEISKAEQMFEIGYNETMKNKTSILQIFG